MSSNFNDPNNHVPEVSPGDDWGDDAEVSGGTILPAKRQRAEPKPARPVKPANKPKPAEAEVHRLAEESEWEDEREGSILPKKRGKNERPAGYFAQPQEEEEEIGLRVIGEGGVEKPENRGGVQKLEVQEVAPKSRAAEEPLPKVVPKQVIEAKAAEPGDEGEEWVGGRVAEGENWGKQKTVPMRWIVISVLAVGLFLVAGAVFLPKFAWQGERAVTTRFSGIEVYDEPGTTADEGVFVLGEGIEEKTRVLAETFVNAEDVETALSVVRDRERVEPVLRERWQAKGFAGSWKVPDTAIWEMKKEHDLNFGLLTGMYPDVKPFRFYIVLENDRPVLDWEASEGQSESTYEDLSKGKGPGGVTRGGISPGDLYTFSVPESDYVCYRIGSPDMEYAIWGYARRDTPVAEQLAELFTPGAIPREMMAEYPATLKLDRAPEDALPNQWIITEMLHIEWVNP